MAGWPFHRHLSCGWITQLQPAPHQGDHTTCLSGALLPHWLEHPLHAGHRAKRVGGNLRIRSLFLCLITKDRSHWHKKCTLFKNKKEKKRTLSSFFFLTFGSPCRWECTSQKRYCYHFQTLTAQPRGLRCLISPFFSFAGSYWKQACLIYEAIPGPQDSESQGLVSSGSWTSFVKLLGCSAGHIINQLGDDNGQGGPDLNSAIFPAILAVSFGMHPYLPRGNALEL